MINVASARDVITRSVASLCSSHPKMMQIELEIKIKIDPNQDHMNLIIFILNISYSMSRNAAEAVLEIKFQQ